MSELLAQNALHTRLNRVVSQVLGVPQESLTEDSSPETVDSWDSLNHLNLVMSLESEFGTTFTPEETVSISSVGAIRELLESDRDEDDEGGIYFEDCRQDHIFEVKAFIAKSYGTNYVLGSNDEYFEWQYKRTATSEGQDYHLRLAIDEGRVVGFLGYIPVEQSFGGKKLRACWLANWMVDPDARQLGLGPLLVKSVSADFDVTLALGANEEARDVLSRMGWTDFGQLKRFVRVIDEQKARTLTGNDDYEWPGEIPVPISSTQIDHIDEFTDCVTALWDRLLGEDPMVSGSRRTAEFLNWRYVAHRQFEYKLLAAVGDRGELIGVGVYRIEQARNEETVIVRILELFGERTALPSLVDKIVHQASIAGATAIDYFGGEGYAQQLMLDRGFLTQEDSAASDIPVLYQPIDRSRGGIRFLADLSRTQDAMFIHQWYVSKADGDQDRPN